MKIRISPRAAQQASILMVSLLVAAIIGATLASYLVMTQNQNVSIFRSQVWNSSMAVTEAGVEDAMQLINRFAGSVGDDLTTWTNYSSGDGWDTSAGSGIYHVKRHIGDASYDVWVTNTYNTSLHLYTPDISAIANLPWTFQYASASQPMFAQAGLPASAFPLARRVAVQTKKDPLFVVAMAATGTIDIKGNNLDTDSFDSGDPNYSNNGLYPVGQISKTKANGDICTDSTLTDTLNIGNANIKGSVKTGPGINTIEIGANGSVGDRAWVEGGNLGIQTGHSATDFNVLFPDVVLPDTTWLTPVSGNYNVDGTNYQYAFLQPGNWDYNLPANPPFKDNVYVGTNVNLRLKINFDINTSKIIFRLANSTNTFLQIFTDHNFSLSGQANIDNPSGHAQQFYLYGLPTCTSITLGGNGAFYGGIYAPEAAFNLSGGGSDALDFIGSSVTKTVVLNGHYNFHYDENLRSIDPSRGLHPTTWQGVSAN